MPAGPGPVRHRVAIAEALPAYMLPAPGIDVYTLAPQGGYDAASGSSMAAAGVTAVVALLQIGLISISDGRGIGFGPRLTQATASSMEGSSHSQ